MERLTDAAAIERLASHHAAMVSELNEAVRALDDACAADDPAAAVREAERLQAYLQNEVVPHAEGEERTLYAEAREADPRLIDLMIYEHGELRRRIDACAALTEGSPGVGSDGGRRAYAGLAHEVAALFAAHAYKEDTYLVPLLVANAPQGRLAELFVAMHA